MFETLLKAIFFSDIFTGMDFRRLISFIFLFIHFILLLIYVVLYMLCSLTSLLRIFVQSKT